MRFAIVAFIIVAGFMVGISQAVAADRPIVPPLVDRCDDLRGMQDDLSRGYTWRWKVKTPERGDCRRIPLLFAS